MWQKPQVMPTRYGGCMSPGCWRYFAASHFAGSNRGLGNFRRPTMPLGSPGTTNMLRIAYLDDAGNPVAEGA